MRRRSYDIGGIDEIVGTGVISTASSMAGTGIDGPDRAAGSDVGACTEAHGAENEAAGAGRET